MSRVGACGDNAAMASFFALLQKNVLDRRRWATRQDDLVSAIEKYHRVHNDDPKPFVWTATAEQILHKVKRARATLKEAKSEMEH